MPSPINRHVQNHTQSAQPLAALAEEIDRKITDYFQAGVRLVWVFYPDSGWVYVYELPTHVSILEGIDALDGGEVLPGFRLPIAQLYEAVAKPQ
jgi:Uma2 family endonuclease